MQERTELTVVLSGARENGTHGGTFRCKRERNSRWQCSGVYAPSPVGAAKATAAPFRAEPGAAGVTRVHDHSAASHATNSSQRVKVGTAHREGVHATHSFRANPGNHRPCSAHDARGKIWVTLSASSNPPQSCIRLLGYYRHWFTDCWDTTDTDSQIVGILQTLIHRLLGYYRHWFTDCWDATDTDSQIVGILQTLIHRLLGCYRHWFTDCWDATDTDSQIVGMLQALIHRLSGYYRHWFIDCWDTTDIDSQTVGMLQTDSQTVGMLQTLIHRGHVTEMLIWNWQPYKIKKKVKKKKRGKKRTKWTTRKKEKKMYFQVMADGKAKYFSTLVAFSPIKLTLTLTSMLNDTDTQVCISSTFSTSSLG